MDQDPDLGGDAMSADLVGWAASDRAQRRPENGPRARAVLATALGVPAAMLASMPDAQVITALARLRRLADQVRRLSSEAAVDELTGALRRGAGLAALEREVARTRRQSTRGLCVLFVDVDGLKRVNDDRGHAAGDELLRAIVAALRERLRAYDLVVRYGGDEFVCALTDTTISGAEAIAQSLRDHVRARTGSTISTGLAELLPGDTVESLLSRADGALYTGRHQRAQAAPAPPPR